ncbi:MAG: hypothetical protein WCA77_03565 [Thermoplasmata archaeon]
MTTTTTQTTYVPTRPSRPILVAILAILLGIIGILYVVGGLFVLLAFGAGTLTGIFPGFGLSGALLGAVIFIVGLIFIAVALGLWRLHTWALVLAVLVLIVEIAGSILGKAYNTTDGLIVLIVLILLLLYFVAVRKHFT